MITTKRRPTRIALGAAASLAAIGVLAGCGSADESDGAAGATDPTTTGSDGSTSESTGSAGSAGSATDDATGSATSGTSSEYQDGTYEATGSYVSPGGRQEVDVSLTIADGVVTAVDVTPEASDPRSVSFQEQFASGIADVVVGVSLDELAVDKVAGSSLTSGGFNDAVEQIKAAALR